ncbi:cytochrome P450 87A3-like [Humulus lupulus]|uniref:cytochrome P450 87A3-like n=1 Tax=Humulus lupulus TaxID=3486 RepID=UPI002B41778B|nr:cytochrome P450 87A3-like [Humulus lupulus]
MWIFLTCIIALIVIKVSHLTYKWQNPKCNGKLPPGSMGLPLIGETLEYFSPHSLYNIPPFYQKRMTRYGSLFRSSLVGQQVVVSTDAEVNYKIFQKEGESFRIGYTESFIEIFGHESMMGFHGTLHKHLKNLVLHLISPENLRFKLLPEMEETTRRHFTSWAHATTVDIKEVSSDMIFEYSAMKLIGYDDMEGAKKLRENFSAFLDGLISFPLNIPGTAYHACLQGRKNALKVIQEKFDERKASNKKYGDYLDHLLEEVSKKNTLLTENMAVNVVFLLLFAAYETTSVAITLAVKFISDHPKVQAELEKEHTSIIKNRENKDSGITWQEYKSMTFTHMVINETMRLANIVPGIFRKVVHDVEINGYTIPANWIVIVVPSTLHLNPDKYEDPLNFNPWRWKGKELHAGSKTFMAFGGGARLCVGAEFAKLQMAIFLHHLVTNFWYGSLFRSSLVGQQVVVSTDAEVNYKIFQKEGESFRIGYTESFIEIFGHESMMGFHGTLHKHLKNLVLHLISPENLRFKLLPEMEETTRRHFTSWAHATTVDIKEVSSDMIFEYSAMKLIGYDDMEGAKKLRENFSAFLDGLISFPLNIPGTAYHACLQGRKNALKVIQEKFDERKASNKKYGDYLDHLLEEVSKKNTLLTENMAVNVVFLLLFAAYETTSVAITLAVKFISDHPKVQAELEKEHTSIIKNRENKDSGITWQEYKSMTFTHMVINETMRLANIVPGIFRKVVHDVEINGYTIPANWIVIVVPSTLHLNPDKYEDPLNFNPWRWKGKELHAGSKTFMAFGGGARLCVGAEFAKLQMAIFLHHLVTNFWWTVVGGNIVRKPYISFPNGLHLKISEKDCEA